MLNSLKADFKRNIKQIVESTDTFAMIWIPIMRKLHQNTVEYFLNLEDKLKALNPLTYPGQNMDMWCSDVRTQVQLLVSSGQYDHKLSRHIINTAMKAGGMIMKNGEQIFSASRNN